ncbi:ATP-NAD kinase family protein [Candidatus Solirubrobacter pratensis]|uniref:ATP-NAD kinase family protein n=1 Tax=Candidatus Solirubrobacter pratensis TaxID=1298857 RepID=UPI0004276169|nr:ATP-NAD kinase family protein [Candidatus Solirubrobacter pratensis]
MVVNPIAGMGGRVALKGTDGPDALRIARERGATPLAPDRARRALGRLDPGTRVLAAPGPMGADLAHAAGLAWEATDSAAGGDRPNTTALDTRNAVAEMSRRGVELLMFAGGDGTARDIHDAIGADVPLVGIPTGVKMHSGVFAATPDAAGAAAAAYLRGAVALQDAEIADVDEDAARRGRVATRLYGSARVPRQPALMLSAKAPTLAADAGLEALCEQLARSLDGLTLLGPGTTTARIAQGTLLGVDAALDGELIATDLGEAGLLSLLDSHADATLILGVVGGQGSLLGRGNQQLSPRVLRRIGCDRIHVVASAEKLLRLSPPVLRVDTGDEGLDAELSGYIRVHVAPGRTIVMKVST